MAKPKKTPSNPDSTGMEPEPSRPDGASPSFLMFIPHELDIEGRPELRTLPANVLFAKLGTNAGVPVMGSALYEPTLSSFDFCRSQCSLTYKNKYGGDCWLRITYHTDKQTWEGEKNVEGKLVGVAFGTDWEGFFTQLTLLGLANGECCVMENIPESFSAT
jgi:hypothetical protein